jgi:hypothetical protein
MFERNLSDLGGLSAVQLALISTSALNALDGQTVAAISSKQFRAFTADQIKVITPTALASLSTDQLKALTTTQVSALTANQKMALTDAQFASLTTTGLATLDRTPIVLDLDGNGVRTTPLSQGVRFDITADGQLDTTGWVGSGDGLLVRDLNGDGLINNALELFGDATELADGLQAQDGFQALSSLDGNGDGKIDQADTSFKSLMVWRDANADGITDSGELKSLSQEGITSIGVRAQSTSQLESGNWIGLTSTFTRNDGSEGTVADVWFKVAVKDSLDDRAIALGDMLASFEGAPAGTSEAVGNTPKSQARPDQGLIAPLPVVAELSELLRAYGDTSGKLLSVPSGTDTVRSLTGDADKDRSNLLAGGGSSIS